MLWMLWTFLSVAAAIVVLAIIFYGGNRSFLLIGKMTSGHHQIELACDACHVSPFGGGELIQNACVGCHGDALKAENDSHPQSKFTDPRNADRTAVLDARYCVTCHQEHRPEITHAMGVTLPDDYCFKCHADIATDRPSHKGLAFTTCASAGCHNFHDNRALYEDFLVQHAHEPAYLAHQHRALVTFLETRGEPIVLPAALTAEQADAPADKKSDPKILSDWLADKHAKAGVNCSGCHTVPSAKEAWIEKPGIEVCQGCHAPEAKSFTEGKHGMRLHPGLFITNDGPFGLWKKQKMPPMTPAEAWLPMKPGRAHEALGCNSCHAAHNFDTKHAAVEACASCHDDPHTRAYFSSQHYEMFKAEMEGEAPAGTGVSCATCHMPVVEARDENDRKIRFTTHNQNENLRPNEKMVRSVCGNCHGLQFTLDALADHGLVERNFSGGVSVHVPSIEWALKRREERTKAKQ